MSRSWLRLSPPQSKTTIAAPNEIHSVAATVVDPHFRYAVAHRLHVAGIARREAADAHRDASARLAVPQFRKSGGKNIGFPDFNLH
jgi:hypothetical protein